MEWILPKDKRPEIDELGIFITWKPKGCDYSYVRASEYKGFDKVARKHYWRLSEYHVAYENEVLAWARIEPYIPKNKHNKVKKRS